MQRRDYIIIKKVISEKNICILEFDEKENGIFDEYERIILKRERRKYS